MTNDRLDTLTVGVVGFLAAVAVVAIILMAIPVEDAVATVVDKQWYTTTSLRERYTVSEYVCDTRSRTSYDGTVETYQDCGWETKERVRTLDTASYSGGAMDVVRYPPIFTETGNDQFNEQSGEFSVSFLLNDEVQISSVRQDDFETRYILGLECVVQLNMARL